MMDRTPPKGLISDDEALAAINALEAKPKRSV
jgi:hypothetical protein